jgi:hypothetical protein
VVSSENAAGDIIAPPRPWTSRAPISMADDVVRPPVSEAAMNSITPAMKIRRRPSRSAARPPSSGNPAKASA